MTWYVYLVLCSNDALYCGIAKDPRKRFDQHAKGRGARYTKVYGAKALVFTEGPYEHGDALRRERQIKGMSKPAKHKLYDASPSA